MIEPQPSEVLPAPAPPVAHEPPVTATAAPDPDETTVEAWAIHVGVGVAHVRHLLEVHELQSGARGTADYFAELFDAAQKARL